MHPSFPPPPGRPGRLVRWAVFLATGAALLRWASPPVALVAGILVSLLIGHPLAHRHRHLTRWLLQACVVLLGFGMNLPAVLRLGRDGSVFAALSIAGTLLLGLWVGSRLKLEGKTSILLAVGTAICGGSAIAAASSVIAATEAQIAVSIGTIFLLNAAALYLFPLAGHWLHLSQAQFGLWAGIAIHDISSVVGAGLSYGPAALATATAVKLARTLWIVPVTLAAARLFRRGSNPADSAAARPPPRVAIPWFIGLFLLASLLRSWVPAIGTWSPQIAETAGRGMTLVLFLIGTSLSISALRMAGWRTVLAGLMLWIFISAGSLAAIRWLHLAA